MIQSLKSGLLSIVKAVLMILVLLVLTAILARMPSSTDSPTHGGSHETTEQGTHD